MGPTPLSGRVWMLPPPVCEGEASQGAARSVAGAGRMTEPHTCPMPALPSLCQGFTVSLVGMQAGHQQAGARSPLGAAGRARPPCRVMWRNPRRPLGWTAPTSKLLWPRSRCPQPIAGGHLSLRRWTLLGSSQARAQVSARILASVPGHRHHEAPEQRTQARRRGWLWEAGR